MKVSYNLVLNAYQKDLGFERLAALVEECAPDIRVSVLRLHRRLPLQRLRLAFRPTLVFSPVRVRRRRLLRGSICEGRELGAFGELSALDAAGVRVPRWFLLDSERDVADRARELGPYVVLKPNYGNRGALVRIIRSGRVRWKPKYAEHRGLIVQEFIYTGRWPVSYRVTTLFGTVLFCVRIEGSDARSPLDGRWDWTGEGKSVVANARDSNYTLDTDEEAMEIARHAARAFPDVGLLGIDVIRDVETGKCFVLEVNSVGLTWHFATETGRAIQRDHGIDLESQFDGIRLAARVLAEETRRRAT